MKLRYIFLLLLWLLPTLALWAQQRRPTPRTKAAYHRTSNSRARARAGAYARHDRSGRRDEENLKLAPGLRLNMPSPPTTDYMGRPLKKKSPRPATGASTISSGTETKQKTTPKPPRR
ncbi:hypothetical protein [Hymenobacter weizhouensis]|uniref:hypothetical protein n=1 Tax=Hymenobacter sp. YIM 151500-1 TaxID=2987689 RepID=UPI002226A712|nr:hypothetical protein [Hymenobacter sp. YIM 151500-1]UYZ62518.1 hypothetical protein OIS53_16150 [Hymenobacter sp. YIM 151500-1]